MGKQGKARREKKERKEEKKMKERKEEKKRRDGKVKEKDLALKEKVIVLRGVWFVSLGSPPPMYTPSPESTAQLMTCVNAVCNVGHKAQKHCDDLL